MAIPEMTEKVRFEDKPGKARDLVMRDCILALFLENELLTERVEKLENFRENKGYMTERRLKTP